MEHLTDEQLNELEEEYIIISKNKNDILDDVDFNNEEERILCDSIITNLEKTASDAIRSMKTAQIPFIGCVRINPVRRGLKESKLHLKAVRKNLTKNQYKEHVRSFVVDLKEKQKDEDRIKLAIFRVRRNNKKKYEKLFKSCGRAYAELFIMSIYWLKEVVFDAEWQNKYDELSNIDRDKLLEEELNETIAINNKHVDDYFVNQPRYRFK